MIKEKGPALLLQEGAGLTTDNDSQHDRTIVGGDSVREVPATVATGGPGPRVSEQYYKNPRGDSAKMTRQHFEFIARVIRELRLDGLSIGNSSRATIIEAVKIGVAQEFAEQLGRTNANFGTDRFITAATKFATNPRARKNPPVDALELVEEMVDKSSVKRVVTLVAEVCELKAQHVKEAWQDAGLAKTWEHDAKALINFVSKLKN